MTYTVKYKRTKDWFWTTVKKVKGDMTSGAPDGHPAIRVLILDDETRLEIPCGDTVFKFSKERFLVIKQNMEREAGQKIPVNTNNKE